MKTARKAARARTRPQRPAPRPAPPELARPSHRRVAAELVEGALREPGVPLAEPVRSEMEARFQHDFSDVRVHSGRASSAASRALEAEAFTTGRQIVFGAGRYQPETVEGRRLLAHELAHTVQQGRFGSLPQALLADPAVRPVSDPLEREADTAAEHAATGRAVPPGLLTVSAPGTAGTIARQPTSVGAAPPLEVPENPAALERIAQEIEQLMARDPDDVFDRVRRRLARLAPGTRAQLLSTLGVRISDPARATLQRLVTGLAPAGEQAEAEAGRVAGETGGAGAAEAEAGRVAGETGGAAGSGVDDVVERMTSREGTAGAPVAAPAPDAAPSEPAEGPVKVPGLEGAEPPAAAEEPAAAKTAEAPARAAASAAGAAPPAPPAGPEGEAAEESSVSDEPAREAEAEAIGEASEVETGDSPAPAGSSAPRPAAADVAEEAGAVAGGGAEAEEPSEEADDARAESAAPTGEPPEEEPEFPADEPATEPGEEEVVEEPTAAAVREDQEIGSVGGEGVAQEAGAPDDADAAEPGEAAEPADPTATATATEAAAGSETPAQDGGVEDVPADGGEVPDSEGATSDSDADAPETDDDAAPMPAGGGAGDGAPIEEPAEPEAPNLAERDPADAMATAGSLPPAQALRALGGVSTAATRSVDAQRSELAANPPTLERPSGAPSAAERAAEEAEAARPPAAPPRVERAAEASASPTPAPEPLPDPSPPPVAGARAPVITGGPEGELSQADAAAFGDSVRRLPTTDPALAVTAGPPPRVALEGNADPARVGEQRATLESATADAQTEGAHDAARPMGETQIYPEVAPETLVGTIGEPTSGASAAPAGGAVSASPGPAPASPAPAVAAGSEDVDPAESAVAQEQRGDEMRAESAQARTDMTARRQEQAAAAAAERTRSNEEIAGLVRDNATQQTDQRRRAREQVREQRGQWSREQQGLVATARADADTNVRTGARDVQRERTAAETEAAGHVADGNRQAADARRDGEAQARTERQRGERESSGVLGWLARRASEFFDGIKRAIQRAFEIARAAVKAAIEAAQRLAAAAIERARQAIVAVIRRVGNALIAIGDRVLAGFPALRDRFRAEIRRRVQQAEDAVNRLASALKEGVQRALNLLGAALDKALGLLEKGLLAVVAAYRAVVMRAIQFARSVIKALAEWGALIRDVAANPIQWLKNLGRSALDGIRNHLWKAFKRAIKRWFNEKLEEVLGLGLVVWRVIKSGGLSLKRVGAMAWKGIKAAIPTALIQILIEKVVALIIPAAGAILAIIEALQAAWGTVQRIFEAFQRFFRFLRAVKTGRAGPQFAEMIAAAAIVVIDFVANWLLKRLRKPAGAIARRIKAIALRLGRRLKRLGKGLMKKLRRRLRRGLRRRRGRRARPDRRARAEKRLAAATQFLGRQLERGMPYTILRAQMLYARVRYRVSARLRDRDDTATLTLTANPQSAIPLVKKGTTAATRSDYRTRAETLLGWLLRHHDIHHLLPKDPVISKWWRALDIDFNDPTLTLELPPFLHQSGVHRGYRRLRTATEGHAQLFKNFQYGWNEQWRWWIEGRMRARGIHNAGQLRAASLQVRREVRQEVLTQIRVMIGVHSGLWRFNLNQFRVGAGGGAHYRNKYRKPLQSLINGMKKTKDPWEIRRLVSAWIAGRKPGKLTRKAARNLSRYWKGRQR